VPAHGSISNAPGTSDGRALTLPFVPDSLEVARAFTRRALVAWHLPDLADDVVLAVNELVTNAFLYGSEPVTLSLTPSGHGVRVEVSDLSRRMPTTPPPSRTSTTGRGLAIVTAISRNWGARRLQAGGKSVWAEFGRVG
jgi:anti-sigma regulatory factor (Ser/Thr protein kinase)